MNIVFDARLLEISNKTGVAHYADRIIRAVLALDTVDHLLLLFSSLRRKIPLTRIPVDSRLTVHMAKVPVIISSVFHERFWYSVFREHFWYDVYLPWKLRALGCEVFHGLDFSVPAPGPYKSVVTIHDLQAFIKTVFMPRAGESF
jgi:hypothetical protein